MAQQIRPVAWNFETPEVNRLIAPIQQGFRDYRAAEQQSVENERQNKLLGFREQEVKQSAERFGLDKQRLERDAEKERLTNLGKAAVAVFEMPDGPAKAARAKALMDGHADLGPKFQQFGINGADPVAAVGMLARSWGEYDPLAVKAKQAQIAQAQAATAASTQSARQSAQLFPGQLEAQKAQLQQIRSQSPEWRAANAQRFGIDPNSPEGRAFVISGQYASKDDIVTLREGETLAQRGRAPDGTPTYKPIIQGEPKAPPEHTAKAANFAARMIEAERNIRGLTEGTDPVSGQAVPTFGASDKTVAITNPLPETIRNMVISPQHQQYRQAAEQWIRAFLRKESGAAIAADEFKRDFVVYFPQPGDSPEVIAQKKQARIAAAEGVAGEGGSYFNRLNPAAAENLKRFRSGQQPAQLTAAPTSSPPPPQPGTVMDGYRFKGGDPADMNSWEPVAAQPAPSPALAPVTPPRVVRVRPQP